MKLYLVTSVVLVPTLASAYNMGGYRFRRPMVVFPRQSSALAAPCSPEAVLRKQQQLVNRAFDRISSPRYEVSDNEEKFQIAVDVPGVKAEDIDISLENDGQVLTLSGHREASSGSYQYASRFSQSFSLDPAVDVDQFSANLQNGVLIVSAPKDFKRIEESIRKIPITQNAEETIPVAKAADTVMHSEDEMEESNEPVEKEDVVDLDTGEGEKNEEAKTDADEAA